MAQQEIETRKVVNRLKHHDGSVQDITVIERRPKRRHETMMRHMANIAAAKKNREAKAAAEAEANAADESPVDDTIGFYVKQDEPTNEA